MVYTGAFLPIRAAPSTGPGPMLDLGDRLDGGMGDMALVWTSRLQHPLPVHYLTTAPDRCLTVPSLPGVGDYLNPAAAPTAPAPPFTLPLGARAGRTWDGVAFEAFTLPL